MLGKALKMEKREVEVFEDGIQNMRMTYYPPCPQPDLVMGLSAHSDASGITILNQINGVNGLQIHKDGDWIPVNITSDALVVNIGDILEVRMDPYSSLYVHPTIIYIYYSILLFLSFFLICHINYFIYLFIVFFIIIINK